MITESDMTELGFKLGDRRKLQRAIREYSGSSASDAGYVARNVPPFYEKSLAPEGQSELKSHTSSTRTTRSYRRHPRADPNAPSKPKTAYMLFGEYVRQNPELTGASFTDLAKETGKRWRELSSEERVDIWENPAAKRQREYKEALAIYKQTDDYRNHQIYLEEFRQQHKSEPTTPADDKISGGFDTSSSSRLPAPQAVPQEDVEMEHTILESPSQGESSPVASGMAEVRQISRALGINPHLSRVAVLPSENITTQAVEDFIRGTGSLLFLWNQDEASNLVRTVYKPENDTRTVFSVEAFAMSTVGSFCDSEGQTVLFREKFLHVFLYMLSSVSDVSELRCMRLFACLAICRFTNNVQSARRLMRKLLKPLDSGTDRLTDGSVGPRYW